MRIHFDLKEVENLDFQMLNPIPIFQLNAPTPSLQLEEFDTCIFINKYKN